MKNTQFIPSKLELLKQKDQQGYGISVDEWKFLKKKIGQIQDKSNLFLNIGFMLLGVSGSAFFTAFICDFSKSDIKLVICWAIFVATLICAVLSLFYGWKQNEINKSTAKDVLEHMKFIEQRYETTEKQIGSLKQSLQNMQDYYQLSTFPNNVVRVSPSKELKKNKDRKKEK